jgi:hypothetical protein
MRVFRAVALIALLTAPICAYAQSPHLNLLPEAKTKTPEEKEAEAVRDKAYQESLKKIPDAKTSSDPWGTVRSGEAPKTSATKTSATKTSDTKTSDTKTSAPAKPRTKTGSSTVN